MFYHHHKSNYRDPNYTCIWATIVTGACGDRAARQQLKNRSSGTSARQLHTFLPETVWTSSLLTPRLHNLHLSCFYFFSPHLCQNVGYTNFSGLSDTRFLPSCSHISSDFDLFTAHYSTWYFKHFPLTLLKSAPVTLHPNSDFTNWYSFLSLISFTPDFKLAEHPWQKCCFPLIHYSDSL